MASPARQRPRAARGIGTPLRTGLPAEATADALVDTAREHVRNGQQKAAIRTLTEALNTDPTHVDALYLQAELLERLDQRDAAIAMMEGVVIQAPEHTQAHFLLGQWFGKRGDTRNAIATMRRVVQLDPGHGPARRQLAALYGSLGFQEHAEYWAYKSVSTDAYSVIEAKKTPKLTVLSLQTAVSGGIRFNRQNAGTLLQQGHVNWFSGIDPDHVTVIRLYVDSLDKKPELVRRLPKADLIINGMTVAELCETPLALAERLCERLNLPVLNAPAAVRQSSRLGTYAQFKDAPGMLAPKIVRLDDPGVDRVDALKAALQAHGFQLPVIVRNPGLNGAQYTQLVTDLTTLRDDDLPEGDLYVIQHHDVWYADERIPDAKIYPKFRAVLVGETLYPAHLRFTIDDFNVHRGASDKVMVEHSWLQDECQRFLDDPAGYLPEGQWEALRQALLKQGLDFTGADFAVSTEPETHGQLVIFEANAAMRSWLTDLPEDDPVQHAWQRIITAFHQHACDKARVDAWDFQLPSGLPARQEALAQWHQAMAQHSVHRAATIATQLSKVYPRDAELHRLRGQALSHLDQDEEAFKALKLSGRLLPGQAVTQHERLDAYLRAGQWRKAHAHLKTLDSAQRQTPAIQRREVAILLQSGVEQSALLQRALELTDKLRKGNTKDVELLRYRSLLQGRQGEYEKSLKGFARASMLIDDQQQASPDITLAPAKTQLLTDWAEVLVRTNTADNLSLACDTLWEACQQRPYSRHTVTAWKRLQATLPKSDQPEHRALVELHATMNRIWDGYKGEKLKVSFGDFGLPYQSFEPLWLPGTRPASYRLAQYGLDDYLPQGARALDIGCNHGYLLMGLAERLSHGEGFDISQACVEVGNAVAQHLGHEHIQLTHQTFDDFMAKEHDTFDLVIACAVHRWIDKPLPEFGQALHGLCADGGLVLLESQGTRQVDATEEGFTENAQAIASAGFEVIKTGGFCDDGVNYREFQLLRKVGGTR